MAMSRMIMMRMAEEKWRRREQEAFLEGVAGPDILNRDGHGKDDDG